MTSVLFFFPWSECHANPLWSPVGTLFALVDPIVPPPVPFFSFFYGLEPSHKLIAAVVFLLGVLSGYTFMWAYDSLTPFFSSS